MPETLFLTTNIIDRFLECKRVSRRNLQLVRSPLLSFSSYFFRNLGVHTLCCRDTTLTWPCMQNLQVGVTAMLVASKYEEIWAPEVKDFVYISDEAYSREQILEMEKIMLNTLRFNLTVPTPFNFLSRFLKAAGASKDTLVGLLSISQ